MSKKTKAKKDAERKERYRIQKHHDRIERQAATKRVGNVPVVPKSVFSDEDHVFWMAHGVNYLLSDWTTGVWTPMFPPIYEGATVPVERMAEALVAKFSGAQGDWPDDGKAALAWLATTREIVYIYAAEAERRLKAKGASDARERARAPHDSTVWEVLNKIRERMSARKASDAK